MIDQEAYVNGLMEQLGLRESRVEFLEREVKACEVEMGQALGLLRTAEQLLLAEVRTEAWHHQRDAFLTTLHALRRARAAREPIPDDVFRQRAVSLFRKMDKYSVLPGACPGCNQQGGKCSTDCELRALLDAEDGRVPRGAKR